MQGIYETEGIYEQDASVPNSALRFVAYLLQYGTLVNTSKKKAYPNSCSSTDKGKTGLNTYSLLIFESIFIYLNLAGFEPGT